MSRSAVLAAALAAFLPGAAPAQSGNFELELNTAADVGAEAGGPACRLTYVATNNTGIALERTSYEVVVFDGGGAVSRILVLEFGALPLGRTRVVQFDLADLGCADISRILVNNQIDCASDAGEHEVCLAALIASSRSQSIQFGL